jgi:hypothetical protein
MTACDASIFNNVHMDILKISVRIIKKWWTSYGLPYVTEVSRVGPEVKFFFVLTILIHCCLLIVVIWSRKTMMAEVRLRLL